MDYEEYRRRQLSSGAEWADFACEVLLSAGMATTQNKSRKKQFEQGENPAGIEYKFQDSMKKYGNLWIEIAEKSRPRCGQYAKSGIYRNDNTWAIVTGDYEHVFFFTISRLREMFPNEHDHKNVIENKTKTSLGYLMSFCTAKRNCEWHIEESPSGKWMRVVEQERKELSALVRKKDSQQLLF